MIEINDVSKIYTRKDTNTQALKDVNLKINKGDIFGVIGYSGAGKSTLIRVVNYLEKPTSGQILINGTDLASINQNLTRGDRKSTRLNSSHVAISYAVLC